MSVESISPFEIRGESRLVPARASGGDNTFSVTSGSKATGIVEYVLITPIVATILCFVAAVCASLVAEHFVGRGTTSTVSAIAAALVVLIVTVRFSIRDYLRRGCSIVTIGLDSVVITHMGRTTKADFNLIDAVRIVPCGRQDQLVLEYADGSACRLPVEVASCAVVGAELENALGPRIAAKYRGKLSDGIAVRVSEVSVRAWLRMLNGLLTFLMAIICMISIKKFATGVELCSEAHTKIRRGWRARKCDFEVLLEGVRPTRGALPSELCRWSTLQRAMIDSSGLLLEFENRRFAASVYAENYWPLAYWVKKSLEEGSKPDRSGDQMVSTG
jgi:hypothetical protein